MEILQSPHEVQECIREWRCAGKSIGFVPTMGALHDGHLALAQVARGGNDKFVSSLFVNPTQFGANEDYGQYPRPFERDCDLLRKVGCDLLFAPRESDLYPPGAGGVQTWVEVGKLGEIWEGVVRPGHLRGVATVVAKLFNVVRPSRAYFGEKDYQQLKVIEHLARDLFFDTEIVPVATVREADGLALSSRNVYLAPDEREAATALSLALHTAAELRRNGEHDTVKLGEAMQRVCETRPLVALQYIAIVDAETLSPLQKLTNEPARALIAARVGSTRLIDNTAL